MSIRFPHYPGERYARLVILEEAGNIRNKRVVKCRCDCGAELVVIAASLRTSFVTAFGTSVAPDSDDLQNTGSKPENNQ